MYHMTAIDMCKTQGKNNRQLGYVLSIKRSDSNTLYITRTYQEFQDFRKHVSSLCNSSDNKIIEPLPELPGKKWFESKKDEEKKKKAVYEFCQQILKLPEEILKSTTVYDFFSRDQSSTEDGLQDVSKHLSSEEKQPGIASEEVHRSESCPQQPVAVNRKGSTFQEELNLAVTSSGLVSRPKPRPRTRAYEEINIQNEGVAIVQPNIDSESRDQTRVPAAVESSEPSADGKTTLPRLVYASLRHNANGIRNSSDFTSSQPSPPVEYAEIVSIHTQHPQHPQQPSGKTGESLVSPTLSDEYAEACNLQNEEKRQSNGDSNFYAEVAPSDVPPPPPSRQRSSNNSSIKSNSTVKSFNSASLDATSAQVASPSSEVLLPPPSMFLNAPSEAKSSLYSGHDPGSFKTSPPLPVMKVQPGSRRQRPQPQSEDHPAPHGVGPLTSIPPMPQIPVPTLSLSEQDIPDLQEIQSENSIGSIGAESGQVQVTAVADYAGSADNVHVLSFKRGALATLIVQSDTHWWCVRLNGECGWVPASYWRMLNSGDCASLSGAGSTPWFSGKLSRNECESLLMKHGKQQHFFVRESTNLPGHYALSVKYNDRVHHFPIELTPERKYNIGKHDFKTITNIISYYKKNALFYDERGCGVTLGNPLVVAEERQVSVE